MPCAKNFTFPYIPPRVFLRQQYGFCGGPTLHKLKLILRNILSLPQALFYKFHSMTYKHNASLVGSILNFYFDLVNEDHIALSPLVHFPPVLRFCKTT